jgi:hypothetical protein
MTLSTIRKSFANVLVGTDAALGDVGRFVHHRNAFRQEVNGLHKHTTTSLNDNKHSGD